MKCFLEQMNIFFFKTRLTLNSRGKARHFSFYKFVYFLWESGINELYKLSIDVLSLRLLGHRSNE
jgi:hypothetical protein